MGFRGGGSNYRNSKLSDKGDSSRKSLEAHSSPDGIQLQDRSDFTFGPSLALDGKSVVDVQVRQSRNKGEQGRSVEECAIAVTKTALVRIRPNPRAFGKEVFGALIDLGTNDREQEYLETIPSDDGFILALCDPHAREGVVQKVDSLDRMELEGGGETLLAL